MYLKQCFTCVVMCLMSSKTFKKYYNKYTQKQKQHLNLYLKKFCCPSYKIDLGYT